MSIQGSITVITANGEVQTKEEATVYVKELDLLMTIKLLEDTTAVLSHEMLCEDHGYSYEWTSGQLPHLIKNGRRMQCNTENYVPIIDWFDNKYIFNFVTARLSKFYIKSSKHTKSEYKQSRMVRPAPRIQKNQKHK